jgi:hypothetical protein
MASTREHYLTAVIYVSASGGNLRTTYQYILLRLVRNRIQKITIWIKEGCSTEFSRT